MAITSSLRFLYNFGGSGLLCGVARADGAVFYIGTAWHSFSYASMYGTGEVETKNLNFVQKVLFWEASRNGICIVTKIVLTYLWEIIVLVIEKNFWNWRLRVENLQTIFGNRIFITSFWRFLRSDKLEQF